LDEKREQAGGAWGKSLLDDRIGLIVHPQVRDYPISKKTTKIV
jgi:hypothetical protein